MNTQYCYSQTWNKISVRLLTKRSDWSQLVAMQLKYCFKKLGPQPRPVQNMCNQDHGPVLMWSGPVQSWSFSGPMDWTLKH